MEPTVTHRVLAYVAGTSHSSIRTLRALHHLAASCDGVELGLEVVDVIDHPTRADRDRIIATPTVIRVFPLPMVRLVGDLSHPDQAAEVIGLLFDR